MGLVGIAKVICGTYSSGPKGFWRHYKCYQSLYLNESVPIIKEYDFIGPIYYKGEQNIFVIIAIETQSASISFLTVDRNRVTVFRS